MGSLGATEAEVAGEGFTTGDDSERGGAALGDGDSVGTLPTGVGC